MPGIFGFMRKGRPNENARSGNEILLAGMADRLSHNPLFVRDLICTETYGLGHIGLPLEGEERFCVDQKRGAAAAFSGYIYGWRNLPGELMSDTSRKARRLIEIHRHDGEHATDTVDGSYCAVVLDLQADTLTLWNDRMGYRSLYYHEDDDLLLFSCEMKAFLAHARFPRDLDPLAVADYFNFGHVFGERTFFAGVKRLRGGHRILATRGGAHVSRTWEGFRYQETPRSTNELIEELDGLYPPILKKRVGKAKTVIVPLSGGLDSRFILGHALRAGIQPHVFTHGRRNCLDHRIARRVASAVRLQNFRFVEIDPCWLVEQGERFVYLTEGMIYLRPAALLTIGAQYHLDPTRSCFLNGIFGGGGNYGKGYLTARDLPDNLTHQEKLASLRVRLLGDSMNAAYYSLFADEHRRFFTERYDPSVEEELQHHQDVSERFCNQKDAFFIRNRLGRMMTQIDVNRFIWHDHFALYDDQLLEFYLRLPPRHRMSRQFLSDYFKAKMPHLARIPYQATRRDLYGRRALWCVYGGERTARLRYYVERLSRGRVQMYDMTEYYHYDQWYRKYRRIREFFEDVLLDSRTTVRGYFREDAMRALLRYQRTGGSAFIVLSRLISFELFNRLLVDR